MMMSDRYFNINICCSTLVVIAGGELHCIRGYLPIFISVYCTVLYCILLYPNKIHMTMYSTFHPKHAPELRKRVQARGLGIHIRFHGESRGKMGIVISANEQEIETKDIIYTLQQEMVRK